MKKVAIFQTDLEIGGIEKSLVNLLNNIDYKNYQIDLYLFSKKNQVFLNDIPKDVNIYYLKPLPEFMKFLPFSLVKLITPGKIKYRYDITIDFNSYSPSTAIQTIKTESDKKVIWIHNDVEIKMKEEWKYRVLHFFFKSKYKSFNKFIAVSYGALDSFKRVHNLKNKKYDVIPNLIDTKEIRKKIKEDVKLKVSDETINLVTVGRLVHQKGFDILINKMSELIKQNKNYHLYIIGDGPLKSDLVLQIRDLRLNKYITLLGYQTNPYAIMNKMDAFVLTSRYEGQGMVFLEALSIGLDVILPDNLSSYVSEVKSTNDIVESMLKLKKHKHTFNPLTEYNENIINKIKKL